MELEHYSIHPTPRLLLHAKHASSSCKSMVIVTLDTGVFIICLLIFRQISGNMYIQCRTKNRLRHIDTSKVGQSLGEEIAKPYKDFMLSLVATQSAPLVVAEKLVL